MFTHLHVHSHFSLLESPIRIEELVASAAILGMKALALTDKYMMGGAVQFYKLAKSSGIKPITGCEICLLEKPSALSHLTLLVKNKKGYENICRLVSKSHVARMTNTAGAAQHVVHSPVMAHAHAANTVPAAHITDMAHTAHVAGYLKNAAGKEPWPALPVIEMEDLERFAGGLVCLSGCSKGRLPRLLKDNNTSEALQFARKLFGIFGHDLYIEIQRYRLAYTAPDADHLQGADPKEGLSSEALHAFSRKTGIPAVATNNVHYLKRNDYRIYRYLSKIKSMGTKTDPTAGIIRSDENYLKSHSEMAMLFSDIPEAIKNTQAIAEKCSFDFDLGNTILPAYKTPGGQSQQHYLAALCNRGLDFRFGSKCPQKVMDRLSRELDIIGKTGFAGYFLIVADIAEFAYKNRIPICGKGSSAGSLVSYLLRISNVDPLENNLYFERFLNEERKEPPDIDIDISSRDREKVWHYLRAKYGKNSIARVSSFSTTKPRASIREAGRILNMAKQDIDYMISSAPGYSRFYTAGHMKRRMRSCGLMDMRDPAFRKILSISEDIGGYIRHISMHPSAFIISNYDLAGKIPLAISETGEIMSQYDMDSIDDVGILKIDLINSLSLDLIADVASMLEKKRGIRLDTAGIPFDDKNVFRLMQEGKTLGVFQLESFGIRTLSKKIKPACLNDITLLVSLYRPGPQQSGMVDSFIERKFKREPVTYIHRDLEPILRETYGVILYQEQVMQVAMKIAGYSLSEADSLRKAMASLSGEKMLSQQQRFMRGGLARGYGAGIVNRVFNLVFKFASYGFVKAHAAAYAEISYKTCFLKYHYPAEFLATILTNNSGYYNKMQYLEEARRLGIELRLPDINKSGFEFTVEDNGRTIRAPLISIKNLGYAGTNCILGERERNGKFAGLADFYFRTSCATAQAAASGEAEAPASGCRLTKTAFENLIKAGAFDFTDIPRKQLLLDFCCLEKFKKPLRALKLQQVQQGRRVKYRVCTESGASSGTGSAALSAGATSEGLFPYDPASVYTGIINDAGAFIEDFTMEEKLAMEALILGFYISANPLQLFRQKLNRPGPGNNLLIRSGLFYSSMKKYYILAAGIIISRRIEKTKNGQDMMFCTMEDEDGMYEAVFFPDACSKYIKIITAGRFVIIKGRLHQKDNNISLIAKDAFSMDSFKKTRDLKKEQALINGFLSGIHSPWAAGQVNEGLEGS